MSKEVAKRQNGMVELRKTLSNADVKRQFENALKENANLFMASITELVSGDKYLQQCNPNDIVREALKAAVLKLPINKQLGFAYIIPFKDHGVMKPNFIPGYKGLIQLAVRTGQYKHINADKVYDGETVKRDRITGDAEISGEPKSNKTIGYFAYIELINGFKKLLYKTNAEIIAHAKKYSKTYGKDFSPWTSEFDKMAKKTLLRELIGTYGIKSVEYLNIDIDYKSEHNSEENDDEIIEVKGEEIEDNPKEIKKETVIEPEPGF